MLEGLWSLFLNTLQWAPLYHISKSCPTYIPLFAFYCGIPLSPTRLHPTATSSPSAYLISTHPSLDFLAPLAQSFFWGVQFGAAVCVRSDEAAFSPWVCCCGSREAGWSRCDRLPQPSLPPSFLAGKAILLTIENLPGPPPENPFGARGHQHRKKNIQGQFFCQGHFKWTN